MLAILFFWNSLTSIIPQVLALEPVRFSGKWQNQRGSTIELIADPSGNLTGSMKTSVGKQEVVADKSGFPLVGFVNGLSVGFVVRWSADTDSITTFSGELKMHDEHDSSQERNRYIYTYKDGASSQ